ncbi:MAG: hypothetical protein IJ615_04805 [Bacteroidaceae bacterium]|nr:hypothetical protein [Bacteroidaceae bacterium]
MSNFITARAVCRVSLALLLCIIGLVRAVAQTDYYYYKGQKEPLYRNENKVCISIPKKYEETIEKIRANVWVMHTIRDNDFAVLVVPRMEYERFASKDSLEEDSKHVIVNPDYFHGKEETVASPYITVKLKQEEDADLLASYAEKYKLRIVGQNSSLSLWYTITLTPECEKNTLGIANELYESGDFKEVSPDLVALYYNFDYPFSPTEFNRGMAWVDGLGYEQDGKYKTEDVLLCYYTTAGDTLINGKQYFRIRRARTCKILGGGEYEVAPGDSPCFYLHEDGGANVWLYTEDKDVFYKLSGNTMYDFMADDLVGKDLYLYNTRKTYAQGGKIPLGLFVMEYADGPLVEGFYWNIHWFDVGKVSEETLLDGSTHQVYDNMFMEGIGPLDGPLTGVGSPNSLSLQLRKFFAFYRGGTLLYRNEGYLSALEADIPNLLDIVTGKTPSGDGLSSPSHSSEENGKTYNLTGQQVSGSHLPRGLYIVGGRKMLSGH